MTPRRLLLSKLGIALCAFGLVGWNQNQVGVDVAHIAQWGNGTVDEPILVNRDNPWLQGWFNTTGVNWSYGVGQYQYSGSCVGTIRTYEFGPPPLEVDDWATPMRPIQGSQSTGGWIGNQLNWASRSGNLIPENSYTVAQAHLCGFGFYSSPAATWFKLAPDVLVVPVVLISWIKTQPAAGPASEQDFRARGRALIDYIPFKGSNTSSAPNPWNAADTAAPELWYEPPDDIWTQCGIQFQVVAEFKFDAQFEQSPCTQPLKDMEFAEEEYTRNQVVTAIGEPSTALLIDQLQPAFAEFGSPTAPTTGERPRSTSTLKSIARIPTRQRCWPTSSGTFCSAPGMSRTRPTSCAAGSHVTGTRSRPTTALRRERRLLSSPSASGRTTSKRNDCLRRTRLHRSTPTRTSRIRAWFPSSGRVAKTEVGGTGRQ